MLVYPVAFDILSDPIRRKHFDSADPTFDESIPADKAYATFAEFEKAFAPVFEGNSRFSKKHPVPQLGSAESLRSELEAFYSFWLHFESWRSFEWYDEDEGSCSDNRLDKRWAEKKNKASRTKRKTEDNARIIRLFETAMKHDPRMRAIKEQEKAAREAKKVASTVIDPRKAAAAKIEEERRAREEVIRAAQARIQEERKEREKAVAKIRDTKQELRDLMSERNFFVPAHERLDSSIANERIGLLEKIFANMNLDELQELRKDLVLTGIAALKRPDMEAADCSEHEWSSAEIQALISAVKAFPGGTVDRWEKISQQVASKSKAERRSTDQVIKMANALKEQPVSAAVSEELVHATQQVAAKKIDLRIYQGEPSTPLSVMEREPESLRTAEPEKITWTAQEQTLLESALIRFPSSREDRWDRVAEMVKTKNKKECKKRFVEISEMLAKKATKQNKKAA